MPEEWCAWRTTYKRQSHWCLVERNWGVEIKIRKGLWERGLWWNATEIYDLITGRVDWNCDRRKREIEWSVAIGAGE